jgi:hypothetical protein
MADQDLLRIESYRRTTPTVFAHAHRLDGFDPMWGLYPGLVPSADAEPDQAPPPAPVLLAMLRELEAASAPCATERAVAVAASIIASYPQRDDTTGVYAKLLARQLGKVPGDMLGRVFEKILKASPDFRPGIGRVQTIIDDQLAKRRVLQRKVEGALRYWQHKAQRQAEEAQPPPGPDFAAGIAAALRLPHLTAGAAAPLVAGPPPVKPRHINPDDPRLARVRRHVGSQE